MQRMYVIGFDGASWRFLQPLVDKGDAPNFARLMREGAHGELTSCVPFQSAAAWVTFMTGKNSGKHGVYMFQDYDAQSYTYVGRTANSRYFSGQTIFDMVGRMGGSVTSVRVPMTYPAWPVEGRMVSGFPTPGDNTESFYPPELKEQVPSAGTGDEGDFRLLTTEAQMQDLDHQMERMSGLIANMRQQNSDLFMVVHRIPDPVHHFFMKFVDQRTPAYDPDAAQRWGDLINRFYRKMDTALGEALATLDEDESVVVLSDHGGNITPPRQLNLNVWLAGKGMLRVKEESKGLVERLYALNQKVLPARLRSMLRRNAPKGVQGGLRNMWQGIQQIDFARTQAYHFPMKCPPLTGIVINVAGRQAQGTVAAEEYESLRSQLMRDVADLRDPKTGEPVVRQIFRREDLYHGEFVERAPDIIVWCHELYKEGPLAQGPIVGEVPYDELVQVPGSHDERGIFLARGRGIAAGKRIEGARLIDVPSTILHAMGLAVPSDMDGRVLTEIFDDGRAVEFTDLDLGRESEESYLSEDEEQQIKEKLKGWGYL